MPACRTTTCTDAAAQCAAAIAIRFQRRGGRKRIVAPDGSDIVPSSKPQPDGTLLKALARAWRWQRMLDEGSTRP
jgi:hypothetical protein